LRTTRASSNSTKGYGIAAKVETHNHPSAVEPFGGAATGVGGVIRDILGVWADPIACTDVLGFGPLDYDYSKLPAGVKHPKYVYMGVTAGISAYGNNMGIPLLTAPYTLTTATQATSSSTAAASGFYP
jgi:phosphoribosylformylglycinamidine (FGAM) synthase-like enzyme